MFCSTTAMMMKDDEVEDDMVAVSSSGLPKQEQENRNVQTVRRTDTRDTEGRLFKNKEDLFVYHFPRRSRGPRDPAPPPATTRFKSRRGG